jgi:leukotriene-A4 hydrolase
MPDQVTDGESGDALQYEVREPEEKNRVLGKPLHIALRRAPGKGEKVTVRIEYETSPTASGIQFVPPSQTAGKKHPYIFTQFQAIHARSGIPHQDTPAAKITYTARLTVPAPLRALMSANPAGEKDNGDGTLSYDFALDVPIPSYLIAIAVGDLHSKRIGPRSLVWTEREQLEESAWEFAETEQYIATAESLVGKYVWGKLDLLILPTSFPLGGMENPTLTFVTPTLLAGDRSLTDTVAHEVAHSWTGNMVTNRTWGHFWLNEGFNTFLERKILQRLGGAKGEQIRSLHVWHCMACHDGNMTCGVW